ncbi:hypothetical protein HKA43_003886 [Escherichia coli]|nr:hypothetical protein [Escherichia coli]EIG1235949.1 hypothetical protein [Escherichia coli]EJN2305314.1 hypothetical protein [Escherichia coli]EMA2754380.1 hypothetical protein [Escherichia coli]MBB7084194.1 hypothetical protein [Escherichia coli]
MFIVTYVAFNNTTLSIILFGVTVDVSLTSIATGIIVGEFITREKTPHEEGVTTTSVILVSVFYIFLAPAILYILLTPLFTNTHDIDYAPHNRKNLSITMLMEI